MLRNSLDCSVDAARPTVNSARPASAVSAAAWSPSPSTTAGSPSWINAGHEIGAHAVSHPDLTTLSSSQLNTEVNQVKTWLNNNFGVKAVSFCHSGVAVLPLKKAMAEVLGQGAVSFP